MVTGMELMRDMVQNESSDMGEVIELLDRSSKSLANKLTAFRMALGSGGWNAGLRDAKNAAKGYYSGNKLELRWMNIDQLYEPGNGWGKVLINLLMLLHDSAPRGGTLEITLPTTQNISILMELRSEQINIADEMIEAFKNHNIDPNTRNIQAIFLQKTLEDMGLKLELENSNPNLVSFKICKI